MVKSRYIGDGHPTFNRNPYNGYINPYYWVDDHPLWYGNHGGLDLGTYDTSFCFDQNSKFFSASFDSERNTKGPKKERLASIIFQGAILFTTFLDINIVLSLRQAKHSHLCSGGSSRAGLEFGLPQAIAMAGARPATLLLLGNCKGFPKLHS